MAVTFPSSPSVGDTYTAPTGTVYQWDGDKWKVNPAASTVSRDLAVQLMSQVGATVDANNNISYPLDSDQFTSAYNSAITAGGVEASGGGGISTVEDSQELYFDVGPSSTDTQNITLSYTNQDQLEFIVIPEQVANTNAVDLGRTFMVRPGQTSEVIRIVPNSADRGRDQSINVNLTAGTITVTTGTTASLKGSIQIIKYNRTVSQVIELPDNNLTTEQTMSSTVTDLSKCFLIAPVYCRSVYIRAPLSSANSLSTHTRYFSGASQRGGIKITGNNTYMCTDTGFGTSYLVEFQ